MGERFLSQDYYDYDSDSEIVSFLKLIEAYWPEMSEWKFI